MVLLALFGALLFPSAGQAQTVPTVSLTITPTSAPSPAAATLKWSSTSAVACTASGSWTGSKTTSGTLALTSLTTAATYTLTCSAADSLGSATLSWEPPTRYTDGTALTDLAGYRIVHGTASNALTSTVDIPNASTTTYVVDSLPGGLRYFAVKSFTAAGVESAMSNIASKTISAFGGRGASASKSVTFTPIKVPNAPGNLTVRDVTAYKMDIGNRDQQKLARIGTVPLHWPCVGQPRTCFYDPQPLCVNQVALGARRDDLVKLTTAAKVPLQVWARCEPAAG